MENLTYKNIVRNLDGTIDSITAKMARIAATRTMSMITEYNDLQNQLRYYKMLRAACEKRDSGVPIINEVEYITEVRALDEVIHTEVEILEKVECPGCGLPILEEYLNCPMCGKHLDWEPILMPTIHTSVKIENGFIKRGNLRKINDVIQIGMDLGGKMNE